MSAGRSANSGFLPQIASFGPAHDQLVQSARLVTGDETRVFDAAPDEIEPRIQLKNKMFGFPKPDRSKRSDPFIGLRPTFDAKLRTPGSIRSFMAHQQAFSGGVLGFKGFQRFQRPSAGSRQAPAPQGDADALYAGGASSSASTYRPASSATPSGDRMVTNTGLSRDAASSLVSRPVHHYLDGSSPRVSRAVALSSSTPEGASSTPRVITARSLLPSEDNKKLAEKKKAPAKTRHAWRSLAKNQITLR